MWKLLLPFFMKLITSSSRPFTIFCRQPIWVKPLECVLGQKTLKLFSGLFSALPPGGKSQNRAHCPCGLVQRSSPPSFIHICWCSRQLLHQKTRVTQMDVVTGLKGGAWPPYEGSLWDHVGRHEGRGSALLRAQCAFCIHVPWAKVWDEVLNPERLHLQWAKVWRDHTIHCLEGLQPSICTIVPM